MRPARATLRWLAALAFAVLGNTAVASAASTPLDPRLFPTPPQLEASVLLWTDIYSRYTSKQVVIHDNLYLDIIYTVLDFSDLDSQNVSDGYKSSVREDSVRKAIHSYEAILEDLAQVGGPRETSPAERRDVEAMFRRVPGGDSKYTSAIERIRSQTGLKDRFEAAVRRSGRYMPTMERIFRAHGLPVELTRLPFVESMFQDRARSKVGAGGIWQFMPGTGRRYLRMRAELDERWDPLAATDGAARLLSDNYDILGTWPLALTAYNHGAAGMARAVRELGTSDLGAIVWGYDGSSFGFASRNFYAEFVAAASVYANRAVYFPAVEPDPPLQFDELIIDHAVPARVLAQQVGTDTDALEDLNLGLTPDVWSGRYALPAGYRLRVPSGMRGAFQTALASIPKSSRTAGAGKFRTHRVAKGETVGTIARRYGTSTQAVLRANGLRSAAKIRVGQNLRLPGGGSGSIEPAPLASPTAAGPVLVAKAKDTNGAVPAAKAVSHAEVEPEPEVRAETRAATHKVRSGETLFGIAKRYGTTAKALQELNGIGASGIVRPGQVLKLAATSPSKPAESAAKVADIEAAPLKSEAARKSTSTRPAKAFTHKVRRGETLVEIASRYGTTVTELKKENRLRGQLIQPNQVLRLPGD